MPSAKAFEKGLKKIFVMILAISGMSKRSCLSVKKPKPSRADCSLRHQLILPLYKVTSPDLSPVFLNISIPSSTRKTAAIRRPYYTKKLSNRPKRTTKTRTDLSGFRRAECLIAYGSTRVRQFLLKNGVIFFRRLLTERSHAGRISLRNEGSSFMDGFSISHNYF